MDKFLLGYLKGIEYAMMCLRAGMKRKKILRWLQRETDRLTPKEAQEGEHDG